MSDDNKRRAELAAKNLETFANALSIDKEGFCMYITCIAHRTIQQAIGGIIFLLIKKWSQSFVDGRCDGRNEELVKRCHTIDGVMKENYGDDWDRLPYV